MATLTGSRPTPARTHPRGRWDTWLIAVVAFVPLLATKTGQIAADTKIYLYLDPGRLLTQAASLWSHEFAFGTVTHQNIGYLLPMGPYFWGAHALGVPMWIAQRLWMGSLLFLAAVGVRRCAEELGLTRWAGWLAAIPYMLTPYILVNIDRTSAIIMPWAGLGWMMLYTIRAARRNDWRNPALFAIVVALVGGVNATSILLVAFAPLLFLLFAARTSEIPWRRCGAVVLRIGVLSTLVSIWWAAGLWAEGKYGINILRFTESFSTVTLTSTSSEVFRGLGYWYFYGHDSLQPWTLTSLSYMTGKVVPTASFLVPLVGFVAALCIRWRYRLLAVATTFLGVVVGVGSYPLAHPTPFGVVFKYLAEHTTAALALRSTNRVVPIVVLGLALLAAAGIQALYARHRALTLLGAAAFVGVACLAMLPLFEGRAIASNLTLPSTLPSYVTAAAQELDQGSTTSNVLGLPGQDFAYYRFGGSEDSIWPGITDRPWISDQVQLEGEPSSINLVRGLDSTLQNGIALPSSIAPIARLLNASDVLVQMNLQYERYASPLPSYMWNLLTPTPAGLSLLKTFGPTTNFQAVNGPYIDEAILGLPKGYTFPPSLAVYRVANPRPLVRTESEQAPEIVAGDGEGLVTMAETGLLNNNRAILFDASLSRPAVKSEADEPGAWLVLTDSNQRRTDTYGTLSATEGYVLTASEKALTSDPGEESLSEFPHAPAGSQTVALMYGLAAVGASGYGNIITNNPEDQPFNAVDGTIATAWTVSAFSPAIGQFFQMTALKAQTISKIHIVQPQSITQNRSITEIGIQVDGGKTYDRTLTAISNQPIGQTVIIPPTRGRTVRITILDDSDHDLDVAHASGVGFAEVGINGFGPATRGLLLPTSLLAAAGPAAATDELSIVTNRLRAATVPPRLDPEYAMLRYFDLPYARTFTLHGLANLNPAASDDTINTLLGRKAAPGVSVKSAEASSELTGSLNDTAWAAFDSDPATTWETRFRTPPGTWVRAKLTAPITLSKFQVTVINDGYHMLPHTMSVSNGTTTEKFTLPVTVAPQTGHLNTEQTVTVTVPPLTGSSFTFTIDSLHLVEVVDRVNGGVNFPPVGLKFHLPGVSSGVTPSSFSSGCHTNYLKIDGRPVPVAVTGSTDAATNQDELTVSPCGTSTITLSAGLHSISSTPGLADGININNIVLTSAATVPAARTASVGATVSPTIDPRPATWDGQSTVHTTVGPADAGRWVVLAQSDANGWQATLAGRDLGAPTLIDGASMGWRLPATIAGEEPLTISWTPQRVVNGALVLSGLALLVALGLAITDRPRRGRLRAATHDVPSDATPRWVGSDARIAIAPRWLYLVACLAGLAVSLALVPVLLLFTWLWLHRRHVGHLLGVAALLGVLAAGVITISATLGQFARDISWPNHIDGANTAAWIGLALWFVVVAGTSTYAGRVRPTHAPADEPAPAPSPATRRRGLNVPDNPEEPEPHPIIATGPPPSGLSRSLFLLRALFRNRHNPNEWQSILSEDAINQIIGRAPLFNRRVLDIADYLSASARTLAERGAHVTAMHRQPPLVRGAASDDETPPHASGALEYSATHIPAPDATFDLVFATNVLSSVADPRALLNELVRVTRPGGTLYLQNTLWTSVLGGRETSPWHLVSGRFARRHYRRRHGREPVNRYQVNFFKLKPRRMLHLVRSRRDLAVFVVGPRFLPMRWGWVVHVPVLRSLLVQDLVIVAERR